MAVFFNIARFILGSVVFLLVAKKIPESVRGAIAVTDIVEIVLMLVTLSFVSGRAFLSRVMFSLSGFIGVLGLAQVVSEYGHSVMSNKPYIVSFRGHVLPIILYLTLILLFIVWVKYVKSKD